MENDEKIGYLIAKVEEFSSDIKSLSTKVDALEKRVDDKFKTAEATFRVVKFIGAIALAILTIKFGDIPSLWSRFFG